LIEYIQSLLEGKGADLKIEALRDVFSDYDPVKNASEKGYHDVNIQTVLFFKIICSNFYCIILVICKKISIVIMAEL
jgi:hypothetical protein